MEALQRGFADVKAGRTKPARDVFNRCAGSMAFRVELAKGAEADLEALYLWVVERAPHQFGEDRVFALPDSRQSSVWPNPRQSGATT